MNILFYSALPTARHGGVVRWMHRMVTTLREMGHRVYVLTWPAAQGSDSARPAALPAGEGWGPDVHGVAIGRWAQRFPLVRFWAPLLAASRAGRRLIEAVGIQVVHTVAVYEAYSALLARGSGPAAVVLSVHGDFVTEMGQRWKSRWRRQLYRPLERRVFRDCDAVTTSSHWLRNQLARQAGATRAVVIPNGISLAAQDESAPERSALGIPEGCRIVLTVNNLYARYRRQGLELLAAAAPDILGRVPDVHFLVAGGVNDPERDAASLAWARELTRGLPFHYTGYRPRSPADLMAVADLYVHSSALDNSPTAVLEAMALGRPIVATGVGGIPELVAHEQTGLLVPLDASALASATVRMLEDRSLAHSLGQRARDHVRGSLTWAQAGERFTDLYGQAVRARQDAARGERPLKGEDGR